MSTQSKCSAFSSSASEGKGSFNNLASDGPPTMVDSAIFSSCTINGIWAPSLALSKYTGSYGIANLDKLVSDFEVRTWMFLLIRRTDSDRAQNMMCEGMLNSAVIANFSPTAPLPSPFLIVQR
jgi:hypothetical protein